jgi:Mg-chelatase subunit ChlD
MKAIIILLSCLFVSSSFATNLFKNGNLDDQNALSRKHENSVQFIEGWHASSNPNPTYFYDKYQNNASPRDRQGIIGLQVYRSKYSAHADFKKREFIQGILNTPLVAGKIYYLSFDVSLHESSKWSVGSLGLMFVDTEKSVVDQVGIEQLKPDIHLNNTEVIVHSAWQRYYVRYRARGGEKSVVFGSFGASRAEENTSRFALRDGMEHSAFYYVDDFQLQAELPDGGCYYQNVTEIATPDRMTLVLDFSGSMRKGKLLDEIQQGVVNSLKTARPSDQITIVGFANSANVLYDGPQSLLTTDSLRIIIERCKLSGATNVYNGLKLALKDEETSERWRDDQIILISDGEFAISKRMERLLASNTSREISFIHLGKKSAASNYADLGIDYFLSEKGAVSEEIGKLFESSLNAETCADISESPQNTQYSFVIDNSGSMDNNAPDLVAMFQLLRKSLNSKLSVRLINSNTEETDLLYSGEIAGMYAEDLGAIMNGIQFDSGDLWERGIQIASDNKNAAFNYHRVIVMTDAHPNDQYLESDAHSLPNEMERNELHLSVLYYDEVVNVWHLFYYDPNTREFEEIQEGSEDIGQLDSLVIQAKTGFEHYRYKLNSRHYKNRSIRSHRRAHRLFNN